MNGSSRGAALRRDAGSPPSKLALQRRLRGAVAWALPAMLLAGCGTTDSAEAPEGTDVQAFTNANIFDGTGAATMTGATMLVQDGKITEIGVDVQVPDGAAVTDLAGAYVIPGLVNVHAHVDSTDAYNTGFDPQDQLDHYAYYGTTTILSLGENDSYLLSVRDSTWTNQSAMPRILASGRIYNPMTPEDARAVVDTLAQENVDFVKIKVDDGLGAVTPMPPEAYNEVILAAGEQDIPVAVHLYKLEAGKGVLRAGAKLIAHSIRDVPVDQEFIDLLTENDACLAPTLVREYSTYAYAEEPEFFQDPFFLENAAPDGIESYITPEMQEAQSGTGAQYWREHLPTASANAKTLQDAGVKIAFGDDTSTAFAGRWQGYFGHVELKMLVDAGLTPQQALIAATATSADCIGRADQVGTLQPGRWADFVVLGADPLQDIMNTRQIQSVWISGQQYR